MRTDWRILHIVCAVVLFCCQPMQAQEAAPAEGVVELDSTDVLNRIQTMQDILRQIYSVTQAMPSAGSENKVKMEGAKVISERLKLAYRAMNQLDFKWNAYYQTIQPEIAENDGLMAAAANFQQLEQSVKDSLASMTGRIDLLIDFCEAESSIPAHEQQYKKLFKEAMELSMVAKTAPQLENLKGKEAVTFADIENHFAKAKEATAAIPALQQRMSMIEQHYIVLKDASEKIQAAAYKPLIQRAKDWLLGLAAVAILLMFFNLVVTKIQAIKKARQSMKQMQELMNGGNNQFYPTI